MDRAIASQRQATAEPARQPSATTAAARHGQPLACPRPGHRQRPPCQAQRLAAAAIASSHAAAWLATLLLAAPTAAAAPTLRPALATPPSAAPAPTAPCAARDPLRRAFFGDLHVHTAYSQDANARGTRLKPADAYRFARGAAVGIGPHDGRGRALRSVRLKRPLDFAAVTDHAEQLGETHICTTPGRAGHNSLVCRIHRRLPAVSYYLMNARYALLGTRWGFCGDGNRHCLDAASAVWQDTRRAAEAAYDRSADCRFTSFVAYEWTADPGAAHLHRNVIFKGAAVPALPITTMETGPYAIALWRQLESQCAGALPGCEAITIPHNPNLSDGLSFNSAIALRGEIRAEEAPLRARYDRLVEMMQRKGQSECVAVPGLGDEACDFELALPTQHMPFAPPPRYEAINYLRDALKRGLLLERRLGVNPLRLGMIGSTDSHLGTPGMTAERGYPGRHARRLPATGLLDDLDANPGGLAVLWAEENRRGTLFAAMRRREAYATSGNRPLLRFFGGWNWPAGLCAARNRIERAYEGGVPMGGALPPPPGAGTAAGAAAPLFFVTALRDPAPGAAPLQRLEIIKGWVEGGELRERVHTVAGGEGGASVELSSCERRGGGHAQLCALWRDPDFDPGQSAFYYARLLENPSCRWSQWACVEAGVDCADADSIVGYEACCDAAHRPVIQERAWSSPIWHTPAAAAGG